MSGHVLIVDSVAPRRGRIEAGLLAARFAVTPCGDSRQAGAIAGAAAPDLMLVDLGEGEGADAASRIVREVRALRAISIGRHGQSAPILALVPSGRADLRLAALGGGAEEAMDRDTAERLIQARIRSLIRARDADRELRFRDEADGLGLASPGLAEAQAPFRAAAGATAGGEPLRATILRADGSAAGGSEGPGVEALSTLACGLGRELRLRLARPEEVDVRAGEPEQDVYLIDARGLHGDPAAGCDAIRQLVELSSHPTTRRAATLLLLPVSAVETAALALDLGAGDVAAGPLPPDELAARMGALLRRRAEAERLRDRIRTHLRAAVRDPLTGLHNRRYAEPALQRMADRARRTGRPLAVLILDIDHFKEVNDRHGHAAGDRVLAEVGRRLRTWAREDDLVARVGGEEFLVVLADAGPAEARDAAEALRRRIGGRPVRLADLGVAGLGLWRTGHAGTPQAPPEDEARVTVSVGVATHHPDDAAGLSLVDLLARADAALYAAKSGGRDTVSLAVSLA